MRKLLITALALLLAIGVAGCGGRDNSQPGGGGGSGSYRKVPFAKVEPGQEPPEVARELEQMKATAGTKVVVKEGITFAIITAGEKSSGGWDVTVLGVGDTEGQVEVVYRMDAPKPGSVNTTAITYPSAVVRFENPGNLPIIFREDKQD